jgi:hypothetical protein
MHYARAQAIVDGVVQNAAGLPQSRKLSQKRPGKSVRSPKVLGQGIGGD